MTGERWMPIAECGILLLLIDSFPHFAKDKLPFELRNSEGVVWFFYFFILRGGGEICYGAARRSRQQRDAKSFSSSASSQRMAHDGLMCSPLVGAWGGWCGRMAMGRYC
jgi:hypothetical protein